MKPKTIRRVLRNKFEHFCASIMDEDVKNALKDNTIITGGSIVSMLLNEKPNDFDIYFRNHRTAMAVTEYFVNQYKEDNPINQIKNIGTKIENIFVSDEEGRIRIMVQSSGVASESRDKEAYQYFEGVTPGDGGATQEKFLDEATSAITDDEEMDEVDVNDPLDPGWPDGDNEHYIEQVMVSLSRRQGKPDVRTDKDGNPLKYRPIFLTSNAITLSGGVQLVLRFYGEPDEIHKNYDFTHCTNYWTSWEDKLEFRKKALESIISKELYYQGSLYPICSVIRLRKFIKRGWTINAGQILKMCYQIFELDLKDPCVLEDQLVGVDVAYFYQLLSMMAKAKPEEINSAYIAELIDKIF